MNEELKNLFPTYHPEDYILSIAPCCGSCLKGKNKIYFILCSAAGAEVEMFPYGYCPQYKRNPDIKMPVIMHQIMNNKYGNGQG